ncbi:MAG TPA: hypothetical protein DEP23_05905 [Ruminococcaceae bacterium]|nr:hypothetical protein [Oscillospiraceae bacterium]
MGLFKNRKVAEREMQNYNYKIKLMYSDGIPELSENTSCEIVLMDSKIVINPVAGPERNISLSLAQINSVNILPWGEYALKYLHTNITIPKNSPGRTYLVINFISSENIQKSISFWGAMQLLKIQNFSEKTMNQVPEKNIQL